MNDTTLRVLREMIRLADTRYGDFASTHEAIGVCLEEWNELLDAVQANDLAGIRGEAMDLAAVCVRLSEQVDNNEAMRKRSVK